MFCIMFKIDVLGTFQGRHYAGLSEIYDTLDRLDFFYFLVVR